MRWVLRPRVLSIEEQASKLGGSLSTDVGEDALPFVAATAQRVYRISKLVSIMVVDKCM